MAEPKCVVYVLRSLSDRDRYYTGVTSDLDGRLSDHDAGRCPHTVDGRPWQVDISVHFADEPRALRFERYLKSGSGCAFSPRPPSLHRTKQPAVLIAAGMDLGEGVADRRPAFAAVRAAFRRIAVLHAGVHAGYPPSPISRDRAKRRIGTARAGETLCSHARV